MVFRVARCEVKVRLSTDLIKDESGQTLVESALFICLLFILVVFALNFNYFIGFINTVHSASARAADYSAQGDLTALGTLPTASTVTATANNEISNTLRNPNETAPNITVCSASSGGCSGFVDPETGVPNTGGFVANSVTVTQRFTPFFGSGSSVLGYNLVPFTTATPVSHTVYMRALQ